MKTLTKPGQRSQLAWEEEQDREYNLDTFIEGGLSLNTFVFEWGY